MSLAPKIDRVINLLKWPAALFSLWLLPRCIPAFLDVLARLADQPAKLAPLAIGFGAYTLLWWFIHNRPIFGSMFSTLEHELTHALFAILTFHRVKDIRVTWFRGGSITYTGPGNWLITISPYFFPTLCFVILGIGTFLPYSARSPLSIALGASVSYHIFSTMRETHVGQTDLQKVGWLFTLVFLPAANIIAFGMVLGFAYSGNAGVVAFWKAMF